MTNSSDYSFPVAATETYASAASGLTKREYLAAKMMAALVSTLVGNDAEEPPFNLEQQSKSFATAAVVYADALIAELSRPSLPSEIGQTPSVEDLSVSSRPSEPDYPISPDQL